MAPAHSRRVQRVTQYRKQRQQRSRDCSSAQSLLPYSIDIESPAYNCVALEKTMIMFSSMAATNMRTPALCLKTPIHLELSPLRFGHISSTGVHRSGSERLCRICFHLNGGAEGGEWMVKV